MLTAPLPVNARLLLQSENNAQKVRMFLFHFVLCTILAHYVYSTIRVLRSNLLLYDKANQCGSHTGILAPAVEIRLSYHQRAEFLTQQVCQSLCSIMVQRAERGNRLNHGMINVICSGLSEIVKFLSPCALFVDFCFICPHPIFYCHSNVITALDFVFANTF